MHASRVNCAWRGFELSLLLLAKLFLKWESLGTISSAVKLEGHFHPDQQLICNALSYWPVQNIPKDTKLCGLFSK